MSIDECETTSWEQSGAHDAMNSLKLITIINQRCGVQLCMLWNSHCKSEQVEITIENINVGLYVSFKIYLTFRTEYQTALVFGVRLNEWNERLDPLSRTMLWKNSVQLY